MNGSSLVVYVQRKCLEQVSRGELKHQCQFAYPSNLDKLSYLNLNSLNLFSSVVKFGHFLADMKFYLSPLQLK